MCTEICRPRANSSTASGLHIPIHIIRDVNDITDDDKDTQRKKRGSKGWYDMETGEVYLVLPNAESIADAQATILHEVVAHKGLRGLLGEKFDDMMDSVYRNLPEDVRRKVTRAMGETSGSRQKSIWLLLQKMVYPSRPFGKR